MRIAYCAARADLLERMPCEGVSSPIDLDIEGRDGCFDSDEIFAVLEAEDLIALRGKIDATLALGNAAGTERLT